MIICHQAPTFDVQAHEHIVNVANALEDMATIRFGAEAFDKAIKEAEKSHHTAANLHATDAALAVAPDHLKALRPRNRAN